LKKILKQKMIKLMIDQFEKKLIQSQSQSWSNLESSKKSVSINAKTQSDAKKTSQTSRKFQTARKNSASEKARTNESTNLTFSSSSFIWAKVMNKNITKIMKQKIKSQIIKLNETIQWKSRKMFLFSKNFVDEINSIKCRNKINKWLKNQKIDILITMINLSRIENNVIFTVSKKKHCKSVNSMSFNLKKRILD
jgi:hypothetical protein